MAVYDAENLDMEIVLRNGTVELYIISSGKFDDSPQQQQLLMDKTENYLNYIMGDEFKVNHPASSPENCCIVLTLGRKPSEKLLDLCRKIRSHVNSCGVDFRVEYQILFVISRKVNL